LTGKSDTQVWISGAMTDPRQLRPFTNSFHPNDELNEFASKCRSDNGDGLPLGPNCFPKTISGSRKRGARVFRKLPDLAYGYGFWFVSERCAEVLRQFDLGAGNLYPVDVFQKDGQTPVADHTWFCINFGNRKSAFLKDASNPNGFNVLPRRDFVSFNNAKDDWIAVSTSALAGPDLWIDPTIKNALFVSGPLGRALQKAQCASGWNLSACRVDDADQGSSRPDAGYLELPTMDVRHWLADAAQECGYGSDMAHTKAR